MTTIHAEIEYQKEDGTWVHSDICPPNCSSENLEYTYKRDSGDFTYRSFLHDCLNEWLDNSKGTGMFYIMEDNYIFKEYNSKDIKFYNFAI